MSFDSAYQHQLLRALGHASLRRQAFGLEPGDFDPELESLASEVLKLSPTTNLSASQIEQIARRLQIKLHAREKHSNDLFALNEIQRWVDDRTTRRNLASAAALYATGRYEEISALFRANGSARKHIPVFDSNQLAHMPKREGLCATHVTDLDIALGGGVAAGETALIMAPPGAGKTSWLIHVCCAVAQENKKSLLVTLEMSAAEIGARIRSRSGKPSRRARIAKQGGVDVVESSPSTVGVSWLERVLVEQEEKQYALVAVDYADLMLTRGAQQALDYESLGGVYMDLSRLAKQYHTAIWTASQVQRHGHDGSLGEHPIGLQHVRGSIKKVDVAHQVLSLNQSEGQKKLGLCGLFLAKNRHGTSGVLVSANVDFRTCLFSS